MNFENSEVVFDPPGPCPEACAPESASLNLGTGPFIRQLRPGTGEKP
jgi:hypothetical protein